MCPSPHEGSVRSDSKRRSQFATVVTATTHRLAIGSADKVAYPDVVTVDAGLSTGSDYASFVLNPGAGGLSSLFNAAMPSGARPSVAAVADVVPGDGPDVVIAEPNASQLRIHQQLPGGVLDMTAVTVPTSFQPLSVAAGSLDVDGDLDLVITMFDPSGLQNFQVLLNNGNGLTYTAQTALDLGSDVNMVALGDINGDNKLDAAVVAHGAFNHGFVHLLLGDGLGGFTLNTSVDLGEFTDPRSLAVVPLAGVGDAAPDVVVAQQQNNQVRILTFDDISMQLVIHDSAFLPAGSLNPVSVAVAPSGDFIVTANFTSDNVTVFTISGGQFGIAASNDVGLEPLSVATADVDNDGFVDIVSADNQSDWMSILLNNGDNTFAEPRHIGAGVSPTFVIASDVNLDGRPDLVNLGDGDPPMMGPALPFVRVTYNNCNCGDG